MHPDRYEHKEPWTEKIKQDNSFSVCLGLVQTFGAYQPHPPQCAHWGTFPKGEGMALPRQWNRRKINDHLYEILGVRRNRYFFGMFGSLAEQTDIAVRNESITNSVNSTLLTPH